MCTNSKSRLRCMDLISNIRSEMGNRAIFRQQWRRWLRRWLRRLPPVLQGYITNFAIAGNPNGMGLPHFPTDGNNATEVGLSATGLNVEINSYMKDPTDNPRCLYT